MPTLASSVAAVVYGHASSPPGSFVALSPQGWGSEGFFESDFQQPLTSWDPITRPVLIATGEGDGTCEPAGDCTGGDTPYRRRIAFEQMRAGNTFLMFIDDTDTYHGLFGTLSTNCVAKGVNSGKCTTFEKWLISTVLAFLDAKVRGINSAQLWLEAGLIRSASQGVVEWHSK